jgi:protein O-mannosyl-transferase
MSYLSFEPDIMIESATTQKPKHSAADLLHVRGAIELLLAATAFIVYAGTLVFRFVYDDRLQVVDNRVLTSWSYVPGYFAHHVWYLIDPHFAPNYYRPIFLLWLKLNYSLFGVSPAGWHLSSVALHVLATVQVYWLGRRLLKHQTAAAIAALLFAVHPVHVESVAWVSGVTDPLMCVSLLGSVLAFLRWQEKRTVTAYAFAMLFGAIALLSKEPAVVLPLLVAVSAWAATPRDSKLSPNERWALLPFVALLVAYVVVRIHVIQGFAHNMGSASVRQMVLTWPAVIVFYLRQLFAPYELSPFHDVAWVVDPFSRGFLLPLALIIGVFVALGVALRTTNERRPLLASLAWMSIPLFPMMNLRVYPEGELVHDRYVYVASIGLVFLLVEIARIMLQHIPEHARISRARAVTVAFTVVFAALTFYNQADWASDLLLFTHALKVAPDSEVAMIDLGTVYAEKGDPQSLQVAEGLFKRVLARNEMHAGANFNLGHAEYQLHDYANAEKHIYRAIQHDPLYAPWWMHFAGVELRQGKMLEAEGAAREAVRLSPQEPGYHAALGAILLESHKVVEAEKEFNLELHSNPNNALARQGLEKIASTRSQQPTTSAR